MSNFTYKEIIKRATNIKNNVAKSYKLGENSKWSYYIAKAIITPKKDIKQINFTEAPKPTGDNISTQITKTNYLKLAKDFITFVETKKRLPNYIEFQNKKIKTEVYTDLFSRILVYYENNKKYPNYANINSKAFNKPTETGNTVYDYTCTKYRKKFTTIDEVLTYVKNNFTYQHYYDDHKSNKQVTDSKSGNCTDLLQWLINMATGMGYESQCIHVKCKSGEGHVFGKFKHPKHTSGNWITRDPAAVANGGDIHKVWCSNGTVQAINPSWFLQNLNR